MKEHIPHTSILQPTLPSAILSSSFHFLFILFMTASNFWRNVFFSFPLFYFPSGFQVRPWLMIQFDYFCNVFPIHFQRLSLISSSSGFWIVLFYSRLLLMLSDQQIYSVSYVDSVYTIYTNYMILYNCLVRSLDFICRHYMVQHFNISIYNGIVKTVNQTRYSNFILNYCYSY